LVRCSKKEAALKSSFFSAYVALELSRQAQPAAFNPIGFHIKRAARPKAARGNSGNGVSNNADQ
jgi:hypothetical protein